MRIYHFGMLAATVAGLVASPAHASPPFPDGIKMHLQLSYTPQCNLCHSGGMTGYGTVHMPFGMAMRDRGLMAEDLASLDTALDRMASDNVDSNGNGVNDIAKLKMGEDPNMGAEGVTAPPQYGCSLRKAEPSSWHGWMVVAIAAAVAWLRTRRKRP